VPLALFFMQKILVVGDYNKDQTQLMTQACGQHGVAVENQVSHWNNVPEEN
jgi:hypothetical protein